MTVWNKAKASAAPQTSTEPFSPKDLTSEGEVFRDRASNTFAEKAQQRRSKKEKENRYHTSATGSEQPASQNKKQTRNRSDLCHRPRSWSSGSSEGGSSSSGNAGDVKSSRGARLRNKSREVSGRSKRGRNNGQVKLSLKDIGKEERRSGSGSNEGAKQHYTKKGKKPFRELHKDPGWGDYNETGEEPNHKKEYMEEPLWYTEPISEYFVPFGWSKLETKYRSKLDSPNENIDSLSERMQGICLADFSFQRTYLAAGTFVDGHFVEAPEEGVEEPNGTSGCPLPEDCKDLDDEHLSELTHFYEVDIYQSILDPSASDAVQESRILSIIQQKSKELRDSEAGRRKVLDGFEPHGESAIRLDSAGATGNDVILTQDMEDIAQMWECCSSSGSEEIDRGNVADSPIGFSSAIGELPFNVGMLPDAFDDPQFQDPNESTSTMNSHFPLFELRCESSPLSAFSFPGDSLASSTDPLGIKQSRLLIWTKNSAFEESEHCSNLSTRTCSPWSHSEETRSDIEPTGALVDEDTGLLMAPIPPPSYLEEEFLDFLQEGPSDQQEELSVGTASGQPSKVSKLESICGIALEQDDLGEQYNPVLFPEDASQRGEDYGSGMIKDIWTVGESDCVLTENCLFSEETTGYQSEMKEPIQKKAVQRSEYHLWEGQNEAKKVQKVDGGDYATPARPWKKESDLESSSFILGGVYGELKTLNGEKEWTVLPPANSSADLLQCASGSEVVTITGTDVIMNSASCFASGHKPLWRPLVSFGQTGQTMKGPVDGQNKGFSFIFSEDLLGSRGGYSGDEQGLDYTFSSLELNDPFSQVLHVECSFKPEDMASFSPGFKPKSILCSDSDTEPFSPRIYGINRTQYRAIRISPRTHFRPISASEISPGWASASDAESEKEDTSLPASDQMDLFDDHQADLKPLEEDAECEGPYYGKSELESGKFLPRLKKSGMEKSAQTSLDSQEGGGTSLPASAEPDICLDCEKAGLTAGISTAVSGTSFRAVEEPSEPFQKEESCPERESCRCAGLEQLVEKTYDVVEDVHEVKALSFFLSFLLFLFFS